MSKFQFEANAYIHPSVGAAPPSRYARYLQGLVGVDHGDGRCCDRGRSMIVCHLQANGLDSGGREGVSGSGRD